MQSLRLAEVLPSWWAGKGDYGDTCRGLAIGVDIVV